MVGRYGHGTSREGVEKRDTVAGGVAGGVAGDFAVQEAELLERQRQTRKSEKGSSWYKLSPKIV